MRGILPVSLKDSEKLVSASERAHYTHFRPFSRQICAQPRPACAHFALTHAQREVSPAQPRL